MCAVCERKQFLSTVLAQDHFYSDCLSTQLTLKIHNRLVMMSCLLRSSGTCSSVSFELDESAPAASLNKSIIYPVQSQGGCCTESVSPERNPRFRMSSEAATAQLGERQTEDLKVPGSIPGGGTDFFFVFSIGFYA